MTQNMMNSKPMSKDKFEEINNFYPKKAAAT